MKKFLAIASIMVMLLVASCTGNSQNADEVAAVDSTAVAIDSVAVDSTAVAADTTVNVAE